MDFEWVCGVDGRVDIGTAPPYRCPWCKQTATYHLREKVPRTPRDGNFARGLVAFLAGAAAGIYAYSATKSEVSALVSFIVISGIASIRFINTLLAWALVIGICWFLYQFSRMT